MQEIKIHDKLFTEYISKAEIQKRVGELAREIEKEYADTTPVLLPILNGAFIFAADLIRELQIASEVQFVKISSYGDEMSHSGQNKMIFGVDIEIEGRDVIIVEDIVDTGMTSEFFREQLKSQHPASVKMAALLYKPEVFKSKYVPEMVGFEIPPAFVIGYGLDYAQRGRELSAIYRLKE